MIGLVSFTHTHTHTHTHTEVAQEGSSNEEEYKPSRVTAGEVEDGQTSNSVIGTYSIYHEMGGSDISEGCLQLGV